MNLNLLRFDTSKKVTEDPNNPDTNDGIVDASPNAIVSNVSVDQSLYFMMKRLVDEKKKKTKRSMIAMEILIINNSYQILNFICQIIRVC